MEICSTMLAMSRRWYRNEFCSTAFRRYDAFVFSQPSSLFPDKILFFPRTHLFFPISVNTALTKTPTYPSTVGEHTINAAARFITYPKLWKKERGSGENAPFVVKK